MFEFIKKLVQPKRNYNDNEATYPMHFNGMEPTTWGMVRFNEIVSIDANTGIVKVTILGYLALFPNQPNSYLIYNNDKYYFEDLSRLAIKIHNDGINNILDNI